MMRSVANIYASSDVAVGSAKIKQPLPGYGIDQVSPFLLLHHAGPVMSQPGTDSLGVGAHPHRGFQPVTFMFAGEIAHSDSFGNRGVIKGGDVQWINAGRGLIHSELGSEEFIRKGGKLELIQLWVNVPKADKMSDPGYQMIRAEEIPEIRESEGLVRMQLVSGRYKGIEGPAKTFTPVTTIKGEMREGAELTLEADDNQNLAIYVLEGDIESGGMTANSHELMHFNNDGSEAHLKSQKGARLLILMGEPINEPVSMGGPFVMNTRAEIMQAFNDYNAGMFGEL